MCPGGVGEPQAGSAPALPGPDGAARSLSTDRNPIQWPGRWLVGICLPGLPSVAHLLRVTESFRQGESHVPRPLGPPPPPPALPRALFLEPLLPP